MPGKKLLLPPIELTRCALLARRPPLRSADFPVVSVSASSSGNEAHAEALPALTKHLPASEIDDALPNIINYLRMNTAHNFTHDNIDTIQRGIVRRMALAAIPATQMTRYLNLIQHDKAELNLLATDLLISFVDRLGSTTASVKRASAQVEQLGTCAQPKCDMTLTDLSNEAFRTVHKETSLTSKEELRARIEELTALNGYLQDTLERQRTTANNLQKTLFGTNVATLLLDPELRLRYFTPAIKKLFTMISRDIGRPLPDLQALAIDPTLAKDARAVLVDGKAQTCEVAVTNDSWFMRHILIYRTEADDVENIIVTYTDISETKRSHVALEAAKRDVEHANLAKSSVLATVSHDLRQPLQSLALLQGLLDAKVKDPASEGLLIRLSQTLATLLAMLNPVPDMHQIEAGSVTAAPADFVIGDRDKCGCATFAKQAHTQKLRPSREMIAVPKKLSEIATVSGASSAAGGPTIYIVDDDYDVRRSLRELLEYDGRNVEDFGDCEAFLAAYHPGGEACLMIDAFLPGIDGIELLHQLKSAGSHLPAIMITGSSAVPMAVEAMKVGAIDFIEKPVSAIDLLASVNRALLLSRDEAKLIDWRADAILHLSGLTPRQHQVMDLVLAGHSSKNIAADLGISQRTIENHRASIMKKTGAKSLPALARLALAAIGSVVAA